MSDTLSESRAPCIWIDADATPKPVREILCKAALRTHVHMYFVANHALPLPTLEWIHSVQVSSGFDVADHYIAQQCQPGDLVITQDIPLASEVIDKKVEAIHPRGEPYSPQTIRQKLNMRDFMETLRSSGIQSGGPAAFDQKDRQLFANTLDRWLARSLAARSKQ